MTPPRWMTVEGKGKVLLLVGLFCFILAFFLRTYLKHQAAVLSFSQSPVSLGVVDENKFPVRILIPKFKIDLPVSSAKVTNDQWEISETRASYLLGSGIPGKAGNTVIYGHNKNHLFGPIRWLGEGDEIKVINKKGEEFIYQVVETKTVSPQELEVLSPTEEATLTLYTCTGFLDRERLVIRATLASGK